MGVLGGWAFSCERGTPVLPGTCDMEEARDQRWIEEERERARAREREREKERAVRETLREREHVKERTRERERDLARLILDPERVEKLPRVARRKVRLGSGLGFRVRGLGRRVYGSREAFG